jgi:hypothetical protein
MNLAPRSLKKTKIKKNLLLFAIIIVFVFPSCGKKQKNIFIFDEKPPQKKIKSHTLLAPTAIKAEKNKDEIKISWYPLEKKSSYEEKMGKIIGYNVYKFSEKQPIPRSPVNKEPIKTTFYLDRTKKHLLYNLSSYYMIRGIFFIDTQIIEGPGSQIIKMSP